MANRLIRSSGHLPDLYLPAGTFPRGDKRQEFEDSCIPEIEPIEHLIRLDFIFAARENDNQVANLLDCGLNYALQTIDGVWNLEKDFYDLLDSPSDSLIDNPFRWGAWLRPIIKDQNNDLQEVQAGRHQWYMKHIPKNIHDVSEAFLRFISDAGLSDENKFRGSVIIPNDQSPDDYATNHKLPKKAVIQEQKLDNLVTPSEYGIELPAPIIVGDFQDRKKYAFIPRSGGLACSCQYKIVNDWVVMCKHELYAAVRVGQKEFDLIPTQLPIDSGLEIPPRMVQFVDSRFVIPRESRSCSFLYSCS